MATYKTNKVIPQMSNNTTPAPFVASASSVLATRAAYRAFDYSIGTDNHWLANATTGWLKIDLGIAYRVGKYIMTDVGENQTVRDPKNWTIQGSSNGADYITLDTRTGFTWTNTESKTFYILNPINYRYYKVDVTLNNGDATYMGIGELVFYELGTPSGFSGGQPWVFMKDMWEKHNKIFRPKGILIPEGI